MMGDWFQDPHGYQICGNSSSLGKVEEYSWLAISTGSAPMDSTDHRDCVPLPGPGAEEGCLRTGYSHLRRPDPSEDLAQDLACHILRVMPWTNGKTLAWGPGDLSLNSRSATD